MRSTPKVNNSNENYRKIYEKATGYEIPDGFDIHHIDFNRHNNDLNNLVALPKELHQRYHNALHFIYSPINLITKIQSSTEQGYMYNNLTSQNISEFVIAFDECVKWMDFKNHLLGKHQDFHGLKSEYFKNY